ncbi:hypothetical protein [Aquiflexum gelatinilyticum]|uniref:hypothetical protein n=1 Tax=Aquiflexum gelatinilyticum TaxID=2961943 RepID=UPI00216A048E|nr:hypothetical protein [Aquiflexum gelatinilyticum]MCS4433165.1 hypothetical protein [Aquiflexum gelatinilyticum]
MKAIGIILVILGVIGTVIFGFQAMQDSESFKLFGMDIAVSTANWTPVIISLAMLVIGVIMSRKK